MYFVELRGMRLLCNAVGMGTLERRMIFLCVALDLHRNSAG